MSPAHVAMEIGEAGAPAAPLIWCASTARRAPPSPPLPASNINYGPGKRHGEGCAPLRSRRAGHVFAGTRTSHQSTRSFPAGAFGEGKVLKKQGERQASRLGSPVMLSARRGASLDGSGYETALGSQASPPEPQLGGSAPPNPLLGSTPAAWCPPAPTFQSPAPKIPLLRATKTCVLSAAAPAPHLEPTARPRGQRRGGESRPHAPVIKRGGGGERTSSGEI